MKLGHRFRSTSVLLAIGFSLLLSGTASAVTVTLAGLSSSAGSDPLSIGDTLSIDLRISNALGPIVGVGVEAHGYDSSIADFVSGQAALSFFHDTIFKSGEPGGGFVNVAQSRAGSPEGSMELGEKDVAGVGEFVEIFQAVSLSPINGDGSLDNGIFGNPVSAGDVHARIVFQLLGPGVTTINFDSGSSGGVVLGDGSLMPVSGFSLDIFPGFVVPEPASAVMLGLGLSALAVRPRIRNRRLRLVIRFESTAAGIDHPCRASRAPSWRTRRDRSPSRRRRVLRSLRCLLRDGGRRHAHLIAEP